MNNSLINKEGLVLIAEMIQSNQDRQSILNQVNELLYIKENGKKSLSIQEKDCINLILILFI